MICIFCGKETGKEKRWHLDCLDQAIEDEFGIDVYNILLEQAAAIKRDRIPGWLEKLIKEGVDEGRRHITRFKIFCYLKLFKQSPEVIRERIMEFNRNCRPPEDEKEVDYHIRYLERYWGRKEGS
jgi:hypothetical protein